MTSKLFHASNYIVALFGLFMLVGLATLAFIGRPVKSDMAGKALPVLDLQPLLNTDSAVSDSDFGDKYVVLHFWGTWCPPCLREFPEFVELAKRFQNSEQVAILSVSCSPQAELNIDKLKEQTASFMSDYDVAIPTYSDSTAMSRQRLAMLTSSGSFGYPTTILAGPDGKIIHAMQGYLPGEMKELAERIEKQL